MLLWQDKKVLTRGSSPTRHARWLGKACIQQSEEDAHWNTREPKLCCFLPFQSLLFPLAVKIFSLLQSAKNLLFPFLFISLIIFTTSPTPSLYICFSSFPFWLETFQASVHKIFTLLKKKKCFSEYINLTVPSAKMTFRPALHSFYWKQGQKKLCWEQCLQTNCISGPVLGVK